MTVFFIDLPVAEIADQTTAIDHRALAWCN